MNSQPHPRYEFGPFRLDPAGHVLQRNGQSVQLEPKVFDLLRFLVENHGQLLQKEVLLKELWPDTFVEEGNLNRNIAIIRKALGEVSSGQRYIETVPKRGYRFVAEVKTIPDNGAGTMAAEVVAGSSQLQTPAPLPEEREPGALSLRRRTVLAGSVLLAVGLLLYALTRWNTAFSVRPEIKSLAVLPLVNLSGDPAQEFFADGMTEALIGSLGQVRALKVISRTSVMSFKGSKLPPMPDIARALGVDGVIEGSVQLEKGRIKLIIQLIHGPTDTHLWAGDYERELTDVLQLQGEMARAIANEIRIQVTPEERARLSSRRTVNPAAHEAYLLGRFHYWKHIIEDHKRAIDHFERAIQLDPDYAPSYAGLSLAWQRWGTQSEANLNEFEPQARAAARKALALDDRLPEAYVAQGHLQSFHDWDWGGGEKSIRRAVELEPRSANAHSGLANAYVQLGRYAEAIETYDKARALRNKPPDNPRFQALLANVYARMGKRNEAKQLLARLPYIANEHASPAAAYAALGEYDAAFKILFRNVKERKNANVVFIKTNPNYASLRSDPRWRELMRRINLPVE